MTPMTEEKLREIEGTLYTGIMPDIDDVRALLEEVQELRRNTLPAPETRPFWENLDQLATAIQAMRPEAQGYACIALVDDTYHSAVRLGAQLGVPVANAMFEFCRTLGGYLKREVHRDYRNAQPF